MPNKILVVDDEIFIRNLASRILIKQGFAVEICESGFEALSILEKNSFDLLLTDIKMPKMTGIELLRRAKEQDPELAAVIITGHGTIELAIEALKQGAHGFVLKPFTPEELLDGINTALEKVNLLRENIRLKAYLPLYQASASLIAELELSQLLNKIVNLVKEETGADRISLMLLNPLKEELKMAAAIGFTDDISMLTGTRLGEGVSGWVAENGKPVIIAGDKAVDLESGPLTGKLSRPELISSASLPIIAGGTTLGVLNLSNLSEDKSFNQSDLEQLSILCGQAGVAIENSRLYANLEQSYFSMVIALCHAMEAKDPYTRGHSERVARYAVETGKRFELSPIDLENLRRASLLHDLGKIGVPDAILNKASTLTDIEAGEIQLHPSIGARIVGEVPGLKPLENIILLHHAFFDGSNSKLKGKDIPIQARILSVTDAFDAMTSQRTYNEPTTFEQAIKELKVTAGKQFDPEIVEVFEQVIKDLPPK